MSAISNLKLAIGKLGLAATVQLLAQKQAKHRRLERLLGSNPGTVKLKSFRCDAINLTEGDREAILEAAAEMLLDRNHIFGFSYGLRSSIDPWNYDFIEEKSWPKRRYEETKVHSENTPKDVKIVWEINRFRFLPILAQAAFITYSDVNFHTATGKNKYLDEIEWRLLSWIEHNPFAESVNWSSPLEIAIRLISWTATLRILSLVGVDLTLDESISRSIWQHAAYLNAELSTDKIVRSNHLIGEAAGLCVAASCFKYEENVFHLLRGRAILADDLPKQTFADGVSREASGWYHSFVTDFLDIVIRTIAQEGYQDNRNGGFAKQFRKMQLYRNSIYASDGEIIKYGDCDFGKAFDLSPKWIDAVFGKNPYSTTERSDFFPTAQHLSARIEKNHLFVRAGEFGWGGDGFSSHAHDDVLSPIIYLDGLPVIADSGTFVYNGNPTERDRFRVDSAHNGLIILNDPNQPILKPGFGWRKVRQDSVITDFHNEGDLLSAKASYGEYKKFHSRYFILSTSACTIEDTFTNIDLSSPKNCQWNFHFHPRWRLEKLTPKRYRLRDYRNNQFEFELSSELAEFELLPYEFSSSYGAKAKAYQLRVSLTIDAPTAVSFSLKKAIA